MRAGFWLSLVCLLLLQLPARAAFPLNAVTDSIKVTTKVATPPADTVKVTHRSLLLKRIDKIMAANADTTTTSVQPEKQERPKRSGIFGRLSLYLASLSVVAFIVALCTMFTPFLLTAVVIWLYSDAFAILFGTIGLVRRRKKGMAIAGIILGASMIALFIAIASFLSAVVSALPAIMATIILIGHI